MKKLKAILTIGAIMLATGLYAQHLSLHDKEFKIEEFPEYVIINCDNFGSVVGKTIQITIQSKGSTYEKVLESFQDFLEKRKYLKISTQTDLLNAMSKLGFDYIDAFPQNSRPDSFSRTAFVFRKKEKYRN